MPLTSLNLGYCGKVQSLAPLKGMRLKSIFLYATRTSRRSRVWNWKIRLTPKTVTKGMDILRQMKSLKTIGVGLQPTEIFPTAEFWKRYDAGEFQ
jgi:hypothetical protein